jgi:hypothetical protein
VVERQVENFIANDCRLDPTRRMLLITGPNMGGKSTTMRQVALIVLLAHVGCFVPASSARIGPVDAIFTRIGASDDLASGRSTFMVEMTEAAAILHGATDQSLVLMDEIGRGTSTFDGVALAVAIARHLLDKNRCWTLFATHYFELTRLAQDYPECANVHLDAVEHNHGIVFLHALEEGPASQSYGIEVAALAGIPAPWCATPSAACAPGEPRDRRRPPGRPVRQPARRRARAPATRCWAPWPPSTRTPSPARPWKRSTSSSAWRRDALPCSAPALALAACGAGAGRRALQLRRARRHALQPLRAPAPARWCSPRWTPSFGGDPRRRHQERRRALRRRAVRGPAGGVRASHTPFVFVPGDNDWTDCHRRAGAYDPLERLARLRVFFAGPADPRPLPAGGGQPGRRPAFGLPGAPALADRPGALRDPQRAGRRQQHRAQPQPRRSSPAHGGVRAWMARPSPGAGRSWKAWC